MASPAHPTARISTPSTRECARTPGSIGLRPRRTRPLRAPALDARRPGRAPPRHPRTRAAHHRHRSLPGAGNILPFSLEDPLAPEDNGFFPLLRRQNSILLAMGEFYVIIGEPAPRSGRAKLRHPGGAPPQRNVPRGLPRHNTDSRRQDVGERSSRLGPRHRREIGHPVPLPRTPAQRRLATGAAAGWDGTAGVERTGAPCDSSTRNPLSWSRPACYGAGVPAAGVPIGSTVMRVPITDTGKDSSTVPS